MPSKRKQVNFRVDDETRTEMDRLKSVMSAVTGLRLSYSDVVRLAVQELGRKHPEDAKEARRGQAAAD